MDVSVFVPWQCPECLCYNSTYVRVYVYPISAVNAHLQTTTMGVGTDHGPIECQLCKNESTIRLDKGLLV